MSQHLGFPHSCFYCPKAPKCPAKFRSSEATGTPEVGAAWSGAPKPWNSALNIFKAVTYREEFVSIIVELNALASCPLYKPPHLTPRVHHPEKNQLESCPRAPSLAGMVQTPRDSPGREGRGRG